MKKHIQDLLRGALQSLQQDGLAIDTELDIEVERTRDAQHGDYATNIALKLAKLVGQKPRDLADKIQGAIAVSDQITKLEIAGPGFINFFVCSDAIHSVVNAILEQGASYGRSKIGAGQRVLVEFVSANPTGPLHVGHGRGAAYGAALSELLSNAGFDVQREYYVNDAGRQMDILGTSVWLRYLELCGEEIDFPTNGYQGDYVFDIAADVHRAHGNKFRHDATKVFANLPQDATADGQGDKELHIDGVIDRAKQLLGAEDYRTIFDAGLDTILDDIRDDLAEFGVVYDRWYSERTLTESGAVERALEKLQAAGHLYDKDGNIWFRSSSFGDEKDRVVRRKNGAITYLASDIAYHMDKLERGFDRLVDIWGADHHGYVARVKAAIEALGANPAQLQVLLVQFAILYVGKERMQMSTRSGEFVTLRELRHEVGNDAARFFYVMRKCEQHMDFDLDLAKSTSNENPVYYIQYAHARIRSVLRQLHEKGLNYDQARGLANLQRLEEAHEQALLTSLARYPELIEAAALAHEPHQIAHYLRVLANDLHTYYNAHQFIVDDDALRDARLVLISATQQVLRNGLSLLGVSAPETM